MVGNPLNLGMRRSTFPKSETSVQGVDCDFISKKGISLLSEMYDQVNALVQTHGYWLW